MFLVKYHQEDVLGLAYENLDTEIRNYMAEEIESSVLDGTIYLSPWLTERGAEEWSGLLLDAARSGSDDTLAAALRQGRIRNTAERRKPSGVMTNYTVPETASHTMAEGEFNRFYVRALCRKVLADGEGILQVYRAKPVANPRSGSEEKIGTTVEAAALLHDLRTSAGLEPTLGLPPGPNSGLTVRII